MRVRPLQTLLSACLLSLIAADAPAGREVVDKTGKAAVTVGDEWVRMEKVEKKQGNTLLSLRWANEGPHDLVPNFLVLVVESDQSLDAEAQGVVDAAKKKIPDQGTAGTIETTKLDGEDARTIVTHSTVTNKPAMRKMVLARHNGVLYLVDFFCDDAQYADRIKTADKVFDSFKWK